MSSSRLTQSTDSESVKEKDLGIVQKPRRFPLSRHGLPRHRSNTECTTSPQYFPRERLAQRRKNPHQDRPEGDVHHIRCLETSRHNIPFFRDETLPERPYSSHNRVTRGFANSPRGFTRQGAHLWEARRQGNSGHSLLRPVHSARSSLAPHHKHRTLQKSGDPIPPAHAALTRSRSLPNTIHDLLRPKGRNPIVQKTQWIRSLTQTKQPRVTPGAGIYDHQPRRLRESRITSC